MRTIANVTLPEELRGIGKCRHVRNGDDVTGQVVSISLVEFEPSTGFYVLYLDGLGQELNDLFFENQAEAIDQLDFEFGSDVALLLQDAIATVKPTTTRPSSEV